MKVLKGFVTLQSLTSNIPNTISPVGEMSLWSQTYTKERGDYTHPTLTDYRLTSTKNIDSVLGEVIVPQTLVNTTITVVDNIKKYLLTYPKPYDLEHLRDTMQGDMSNQIQNLNLGPLVESAVIWLPEWISFITVNDTTQSVKVWLSDEAFQYQYDEYEITTIAPIETLDDFFLSPTVVKNKISSITYQKKLERIQAAKGANPETYILSLSFDYVNPLNASDKTATDWSVLIYGEEGNYIDSIKDAIIEYILTHSTHTRDEWEAILPDLFKRTEFIIIPRWDKFAIPELVFNHGIYGAIMDPLESIDTATRIVNYYPSEHIRYNTNIVPHHYSNLSLNIVNGLKNLEGKQKFNELFSDYINVPTTSLDFNRMSEYTRLWMLGIYEGLLKAEKITQLEAIRKPYRKVNRGDQLYVAWLYDNVNYLIHCKSNWEV